MSQIAKYLFSVIASTFVVSIISIIPGSKTSLSAIIKIICGLFLVLTVVSPLSNIQLKVPTELLSSVSVDCDAIIEDATTIAYDAKAAIIIDQVSAYVLEKAKALNLDVEVELVLGSDEIPVPEQIYIQGAVSPFARNQLSTFISDNIGIPEERQIWS